MSKEETKHLERIIRQHKTQVRRLELKAVRAHERKLKAENDRGDILETIHYYEAEIVKAHDRIGTLIVNEPELPDSSNNSQD